MSMFKVSIVSKINPKRRKTISFFLNKENAEKLVNTLNFAKLVAFYKIKLSKDVWNSLPAEISSQIVSKNEDNYVLMNVNYDLKESIFSYIRSRGKRSFSHFFASCDFSKRKTIMENDLNTFFPDIAKNIAKGIHFFQQDYMQYVFEFKEIPLH